MHRRASEAASRRHSRQRFQFKKTCSSRGLDSRGRLHRRRKCVCQPRDMVDATMGGGRQSKEFSRTARGGCWHPQTYTPAACPCSFLSCVVCLLSTVARAGAEHEGTKLRARGPLTSMWYDTCHQAEMERRPASLLFRFGALSTAVNRRLLESAGRWTGPRRCRN